MTTTKRELLLHLAAKHGNIHQPHLSYRDLSNAHTYIHDGIGHSGPPVDHTHKCECSVTTAHWGEDVHGNEYRIDCGCPCVKCREY